MKSCAIMMICCLVAFGTNVASARTPTSDSLRHFKLVREAHSTDLLDVALLCGSYVVKNLPPRTADTTRTDIGKLHTSILPGVGYSIQTGFSAVLQSNCGFYMADGADANLSAVEASFNYTQLHQILIPLQGNLWTADNRYNLQTDWRFLQFPQLTYGLGGYSSISNAYTFDFTNVRLYTTLYRALVPDIFIGIGANIDLLWNVHEVNPPTGEVTDFQRYGVSSNSVSSAPSLNFLYDTRRNSINPSGGNFVNVVYRPCLTAFGSTTNWQSLIVDLRKFIPLPVGTGNVLAFWSYDWLTPSGAPPYPLLPNLGGDPYGNTGRGFNEGRFRGPDMVYAECEYRFHITRNRLFGGVVFANTESIAQTNGQFARISAGYGAGIRVKFNKYSKTNVAIDYGFGTDGSKGVFINLGEVF